MLLSNEFGFVLFFFWGFFGFFYFWISTNFFFVSCYCKQRMRWICKKNKVAFVIGSRAHNMSFDYLFFIHEFFLLLHSVCLLIAVCAWFYTLSSSDVFQFIGIRLYTIVQCVRIQQNQYQTCSIERVKKK